MSKLDRLILGTSWSSSFVRLGIVYGGALILHYFPTIATWYAGYILKRKAIATQNSFLMGIVYFTVIVSTIFEVINIVRMVKEKKKQRRLLNED